MWLLQRHALPVCSEILKDKEIEMLDVKELRRRLEFFPTTKAVCFLPDKAEPIVCEIDRLYDQDELHSLIYREQPNSQDINDLARVLEYCTVEFFRTDDLQTFMACFVSMIRSPRYRAGMCLADGQRRKECSLQHVRKTFGFTEGEIMSVVNAIAKLSPEDVTGEIWVRTTGEHRGEVNLMVRALQIHVYYMERHGREEEKQTESVEQPLQVEDAAPIIEAPTATDEKPDAENVIVPIDDDGSNDDGVRNDVHPHGSVKASVEDTVRRSVRRVQTLPNRQKLVEVSIGTKVHYIVVDEGVDIYRAPKIYDMVCREQLHLSFNITTDRLERCWQIERLLDEGWRQHEVAELLEVPQSIVYADVRVLRNMGRNIARLNRTGKNNLQQGDER